MYIFEDTIFERLLDALKVGDRVIVTSHLFYEFKTNSERVALAYQLLEEENLLPNLESNSKKSVKLASDLRNEGNNAFQNRKDLAALQLYNRSLAAAPLNSKEYALAIGNRSAVNLSLKFYEACLCDIKLALQSDYPLELRFKLLERKVKCFLQLGMKSDAEETLKEIEAEWEKRPDGKKAHETNLKALYQDLEGLQPDEIVMPLSSNKRVGCSKRPHLSYDANTEINCASNCVALKYSEEKGRHLVATRDIRPGDVLIVEQPFASVLLPEAFATHCYNCFSRCLSPVPCLHCSEVIFCNEKCRLECWESIHSVDCSLLPVLCKKVSKMSLLALRVLLVASQKGGGLRSLFEEVENLKVSKNPRTLGFNEEGHYVSTDYWPIHFLIGHSDKRANADLFRRSVTAACLLHCLENFSDFFQGDFDDELYYFCGGLLLQHLQSLPCNAHEVSEMIVKAGCFESQEIGAAGYATLSLLNHSCDPNVVRHSYGDWAVLRAIQPIQQGEDILDNYGYHHALHSVDERQSQLSKQYFFHCLCQACQCTWPFYKDQPTENPMFKCCQCGVVYKKDQQLADQIHCSCGAVNDSLKLEMELNNSSKLFRKTLSSVLNGNYPEHVPESLFEHLILLSNNVQRPWREFSECQETIKQCLSLQANHITISN